MGIRTTPVRRALARNLATVALGAAAARIGWRLAASAPGRDRWERVNHRGETLTLLQGPVVAGAAAAATALAPGIPARVRAAGLVAVLGGAGFGVLDDLTEKGSAKGLRGHLTAARNGEITTGLVKLVGIGVTGLVAAGLGLPDEGGGRLRRGVDLLVAGAGVAAAANVVNLLDLRPGRATKVVLLHSPALLTSPGGALAGAAIGSAGALMPEDLAERCMLGDGGANALGALLGAAVITTGGRRGRLALFVVHAALVLASERVSFTRVIEATPGLRELDAWGRRPA